MQHLGDFRIDEYVTFGVQLHRFSSGAVYAPTGSVTYTFYENNSTSSAPTGGNLAQLNSKTGLYSARVQLTTAAGFEAGKDYFVHVEATVDSVAAGELFMFRVVDVPTVDVTSLGGSTQSATDLKDFADTGYDPSTHKVQGVVLVDTLTTYTNNTPQTGDAYAKVDTEVAALQSDLTAVKAKTDNLPSDPADASDIATATNAIAGYIDTEVAAIKAKTDNLPSDPADASDIAAAFSTVNSTLSTIAAYIDTEIAAIKAKTDTIPASPAAVGSAMTLEDGAITAAKIASDALSAVKIATDACQKIADIMLRRGSANIEASSNGDTLAFKSLYGAIAMQTHEKDASSGTSLEVKKADGSTTLATITLDTDAAAEPIVGTGSA